MVVVLDPALLMRELKDSAREAKSAQVQIKQLSKPQMSKLKKDWVALIRLSNEAYDLVEPKQ